MADNPTSSESEKPFGQWLRKWHLTPDGEALSGPNSQVLPVRRANKPLMLKAAMQPREVRAGEYLHWLGGSSSVEVLERESDALLMERAIGESSLVEMEDAGQREAALSLLCEVARALHTPKASAPSGVMPLELWLQRLSDIAPSNSRLEVCAKRANAMLSEPQEVRALHGDLHHWNVLDGGSRGWLAIDPNGLIGERAFEFALMVLPTNLVEDTNPNVLRERSHIVAKLANIDPKRLLAWVSIQAGLWASWSAPGRDWLAIVEAAEAGLND